MGWIEEESKKTEQESKSFDDYFIKTEKIKGIVVLLYGDTGSGKTYTSMTFPEPIFIIDTENRADRTAYYQFRDKKIHIFQPKQIKTKYDPKDADALDTHKTIEDITKFIIEFANKVKSGEIKEGTIVVDSCTDIWSLIQDWGIHELAKYSNKDGSKKANVMLMRVNQQTDWRIMNNRHEELLGILRSLIKYGINIVFTARESTPPEYVKNTATLKDRMRAQKDLPFVCDVIFHLNRRIAGGKFIYVAECEKLLAFNPPKSEIFNVDYNKIKELIEKAENENSQTNVQLGRV